MFMSPRSTVIQPSHKAKDVWGSNNHTKLTTNRHVFELSPILTISLNPTKTLSITASVPCHLSELCGYGWCRFASVGDVKKIGNHIDTTKLKEQVHLLCSLMHQIGGIPYL